SLAVGGEEPDFLRFAVIFAIWGLFRFFGYTSGSLAEKIKDKKTPKLHPLINFLARFACLIPLAAFIAACAIFSLPSAFYFYTLPPSAAIYFAGYSSVGRSYSDVFTKGWFAVYPISALLLSIMLSAGKITAPWAGNMLSAGLAVEILIFVVIANQANIDKCTKQRDAGKAALPRGLRRYNATLVIAVFALSLGLFIFAEPLGQIIVTAIVAIIGAVMLFVEFLGKIFTSSNESAEQTHGGESHLTTIPTRFGISSDDFFIALVVIVAVIMIIAFRKQIWSAFKRAFAAAFKNRDKRFDTPYVDEISTSRQNVKKRAAKKAERELAKKYARETSPALRYRLGYALFLARLRRTENPPAPSDTTEIHREKGERSFKADLSELSKTYDKVRYGDAVPTADELEAQAEIIRSLSSKKLP
ncbi:MAG: DUF4129 domain-containing protein, partial [Oscillospiraceae bacterium]|nr:DUF4129 domain-containing protein [Oscillospiraceae bacterium]